jgi:hypothetical protein
MNRSIQSKMRRASAYEQDGDAMPETLRTGAVNATRAAIDAYAKKRGLNTNPWKRKKPRSPQ